MKEMKEIVHEARIRGAEWHGVANKMRDCAISENNDINEWCMDQAKVAWARGDEAYAIAKMIEGSK